MRSTGTGPGLRKTWISPRDAAGSLSLIPAQLPDLHVFSQHARTRFAAEHIAVFVDGAKLRAAPRRRGRVTTLIQDEVLHPAAQGISDPDSLLKARIVDVVGL